MLMRNCGQSRVNVGCRCYSVSLGCISKFPHLFHECLRLFALRRVRSAKHSHEPMCLVVGTAHVVKHNLQRCLARGSNLRLALGRGFIGRAFAAPAGFGSTLLMSHCTFPL